MLVAVLLLLLLLFVRLNVGDICMQEGIGLKVGEADRHKRLAVPASGPKAATRDTIWLLSG
jgi:hypothetical protein